MKAIILIVSLFVGLQAIAIEKTQAKFKYRADYCQKETPLEPKIKMEDMGWGQTLKVMAEKFNTIYESGKRLEFRSHMVGSDFVLPLKNGTQVFLGKQFINSVVSHIEVALERSYVDYIFFSDMGHSHMFIDNKTYYEKVSPISNSDKKAKYEIMLNDPKTKFLYHTAEQLHMKDKDTKIILPDRKVQWRFYTRNIIGDNLASEKLEIIHAPHSGFNTAKSDDFDPGEKKYRYWGAGYSISASKNGCFEFKNKGQSYYFDISLYDVAYDTVSSDF